MSRIVTELQTQISGIVDLNPIDRSRVTAMVLANSIATQINVPSTKVPNPKIYYIENHRSAVEAIVSEVNELMVIDGALVIELVEQFWNIRYRFINEPFDNTSMNIMAVLCQIGGALGAQFSELADKYPGFSYINPGLLNAVTSRGE